MQLSSRTRTKTPFTSASLCNGFTPLTAFMTETEFMSQRVNNLINSVDPTFYEGLERLRNAIKHFPNVRAFAGHRSYPHGRTVLELQPKDFFTRDTRGFRSRLECSHLARLVHGGGIREDTSTWPPSAFLTGGCPCSARGVPRARSGGLVGRTEICLEHYTQGDLWKYANIEL